LDDTPGEDSVPKLPDARSIRDLSEVLGDENAMKVFRAPDGTLEAPRVRYEVDHPADWYPQLLAAAASGEVLDARHASEPGSNNA